MYHIFFITSFIDYFHVLAIISNAVMNMRYSYLLELTFLFSSAKYSEEELLDHVAVLFLIFWETFILFSIGAVYIPPFLVVRNTTDLTISPDLSAFLGYNAEQ